MRSGRGVGSEPSRGDESGNRGASRASTAAGSLEAGQLACGAIGNACCAASDSIVRIADGAEDRRIESNE